MLPVSELVPSSIYTTLRLYIVHMYVCTGRHVNRWQFYQHLLLKHFFSNGILMTILRPDSEMPNMTESKLHSSPQYPSACVSVRVYLCLYVYLFM